MHVDAKVRIIFMPLCPEMYVSLNMNIEGNVILIFPYIYLPVPVRILFRGEM